MKVRKSTKALRSLQKTPQSKRVINLSAWPGPSSTYRLWGYPLREKLRAPDNWSFEPDRRRRGIFYCSRQAVQHSWTGRHTVCRFQASTLSSGVSGCTLNAALPLRSISHHCRATPTVYVARPTHLYPLPSRTTISTSFADHPSTISTSSPTSVGNYKCHLQLVAATFSNLGLVVISGSRFKR